MKAIQLHAYGPADCLVYEEVPDPAPYADEVLVAVEAAGVNPADFKFRSGLLSEAVTLPMPFTPGMDIAGSIVAVGSKVEQFHPGDRVMAMLSFMTSGGYAELAAVPADWCTLIPSNLDAVTAASLPTPASTALQLVENDLAVKAGQRVLVTGAAGAVGTVACFAARQHGAHVTAAVRKDKVEAVQHADDVFIIGNDISAMSGKFDCIVDTVGGKTAQGLLPLLKNGGVISSVATDRFANVEELDIEIRYFGVKPEAEGLGLMAEAVAWGDLKTPVPRTMKLSEAAEAHRQMEAGGAGKIVLIPDSLDRA